MSNEKKREVLLVLIYACFWDRQDRDGLLSCIHQQLKVSRACVSELLDSVSDIARVYVSLEKKIQKHCNCLWESVGHLERSILTLCCYQLLYLKGLDRSIVISEGVRLAKKFSDVPCSAFINAVLDSFANNET